MATGAINAVALIQQIEERIRFGAQTGLMEAAELVKQEAKKRIGHDQSDWPPLAEVTVEEKARLGDPPDPLLRTGSLRESIEAHVVGLHAKIGTNHPLGVIHEHGAGTTPPRPFLQPALHNNINEIKAILRRHIAIALHV